MPVANFTSKKLHDFFKKSELTVYKKGQIILKPDDLSRNVFYIEKGFVRVYSLTEWGEEKLFLIYKEDEIFPLFWLFDNLPLIRFYEAINIVHIRKVSKNDFLKFIELHPDAHMELTKKLVAMFDILINRIDSLEYTNVYARVVSRLLYLAKRFGITQDGKVIIKVPISHKDLASSIGATRETVSRDIEKLEKKGLIAYFKDYLQINDQELLMKEMAAHYDKKLL